MIVTHDRHKHTSRANIWCLNEQVCQGGQKVYSALSGPTHWILHYTISKLPLPFFLPVESLPGAALRDAPRADILRQIASNTTPRSADILTPIIQHRHQYRHDNGHKYNKCLFDEV